jgi:hypothetical protein
MTQNSADAKKKSASISEICGSHPVQTMPFTLREAGSIEANPQMTQSSADAKESNQCQSVQSVSEKNKSAPIGAICGQPPRLVFESDAPFVRLYHGNSLDLLDAIYAKYGDAGRFDAIFADPPYFLSNGGITCHAGKMVKVDKGDWDVSRGPELNHEFNTE